MTVSTQYSPLQLVDDQLAAVKAVLAAALMREVDTLDEFLDLTSLAIWAFPVVGGSHTCDLLTAALRGPRALPHERALLAQFIYQFTDEGSEQYLSGLLVEVATDENPSDYYLLANEARFVLQLLGSAEFIVKACTLADIFTAMQTLRPPELRVWLADLVNFDAVFRNRIDLIGRLKPEVQRVLALGREVLKNRANLITS